MNQSFTLFTSFLNKDEKANSIMIWRKIQETSFANNETFKSYFQRKSRFYWRGKPSNNVNTVEEEQDETDVDGIWNLMDLPKLMFIDGECGNLKVAVGGR